MIDLQELKDLLLRQTEIREKIAECPTRRYSVKGHFELLTLRNNLALLDSQIRNALVGAAPELIRLAEIGAAANQSGYVNRTSMAGIPGRIG